MAGDLTMMAGLFFDRQRRLIAELQVVSAGFRDFSDFSATAANRLADGNVSEVQLRI